MRLKIFFLIDYLAKSKQIYHSQASTVSRETPHNRSYPSKRNQINAIHEPLKEVLLLAPHS